MTLRIHGAVRRAGQPVEGAYITLNEGDTFIAERRTGPDGAYEFNTTAGTWVLNCRTSESDPVRREVTAHDGESRADFDL